MYGCSEGGDDECVRSACNYLDPLECKLLTSKDLAPYGIRNMTVDIVISRMHGKMRIMLSGRLGHSDSYGLGNHRCSVLLSLRRQIALLATNKEHHNEDLFTN